MERPSLLAMQSVDIELQKNNKSTKILKIHLKQQSVMGLPPAWMRTLKERIVSVAMELCDRLTADL